MAKLMVLLEELANLLESGTWKAVLLPSILKEEAGSVFRVHSRLEDMLRGALGVWT